MSDAPQEKDVTTDSKKDPKSETTKAPPARGAPAAGSSSSRSAGKSASAASPRPAPAASPKTLPEGEKWWWGTGRRKTAVARVRIRPGQGKFLVNKRELDDYFNEERDRSDIHRVMERTSTTGRVDVHVNVLGGGFMGQAGAIVLGLGRALLRYDPTLESILRDNGFLTRDAREVERKKYGQAGARRRYQFSKR